MSVYKHAPVPFRGKRAGYYRVLYVDPPWPYFGSPTKQGAAGKEYDLMTLDDIKALPVMDLADRKNKAALFLWVTGPKLDMGIDTLRHWGFHYRGIAYIWLKTRKDGAIISGQGPRPTLVKQMVELVLAGTTCKTGRPFPLHTERQSQYVFTEESAVPIMRQRPRGDDGKIIHSKKPAVVRDRITELAGPNIRKIELFARNPSPGWHVWGNQTDKFSS